MPRREAAMTNLTVYNIGDYDESVTRLINSEYVNINTYSLNRNR